MMLPMSPSAHPAPQQDACPAIDNVDGQRAGIIDVGRAVCAGAIHEIGADQVDALRGVGVVLNDEIGRFGRRLLIAARRQLGVDAGLHQMAEDRIAVEPRIAG